MDIEKDERNRLIEEIAEFIGEHVPEEGENSTLVPGVFFVRREDPNFCWHGFTRPMAALVCQGSKMLQHGGTQDIARPGELILTSVDMPGTVGITNISEGKPFISMFFLLNRKLFAELLADLPWHARGHGESDSSRYIRQASVEFLETIKRLVKIACNSQDASILGHLLLKELHYLLLKGSQGIFLRHLYMHGTNDNRIVEAISFLKNHLGRPVSLEELSRKVFMSVSSLHRHFKKVTGLSPLQYHKELRLFEAQRLMLLENERADVAAMKVGYESVTQFNREYKRKFGLPPHQDIVSRKAIFSSKK